MRRIVAWSLLATLSLAACTASGSPTPSTEASEPAVSGAPVAAATADPGKPRSSGPRRLIALGDGYPFGAGTAAPQRDSWPSQLAEAMTSGGTRVVLRNLAEQGHTSGQVLEEQLWQVASWEPDVVTLQVGANDILTLEVPRYRDNLGAIFDELLLILPPERIFAITTPDHTLVGYGDAYQTEEIHVSVDEVNDTLREVAIERGIDVIDIAPVDELVTGDPSLVIDKGPYGTPKQYAGWVEIIGPPVARALQAIEP